MDDSFFFRANWVRAVVCDIGQMKQLRPYQDNSAPPLDPSSLPDHIDTISCFHRGPSKGWIASTSLPRYTSLFLVLQPPIHCHWPLPGWLYFVFSAISAKRCCLVVFLHVRHSGRPATAEWLVTACKIRHSRDKSYLGEMKWSRSLIFVSCCGLGRD
jgi:hypothetical protein